MARRKRTDEQDQELQNQFNSSVGKKSRGKSEKSPFLLSRMTYQNFTDDEKKQADLYIKKGEWVVISSKEDIAHDFLIFMLLRDCVKRGYFKQFLENFVARYRQEHPQDYINLIGKIVSIIEDTHFSEGDVEIIMKGYQESLSNA